MDKQDSMTAKPKTKAKAKQNTGDSVNWQFNPPKREFSAKWYMGMTLGLIALLAMAIFLIKSWSFVAVLVVIIPALVVLVRRPSKPIHYSLTSDGIVVDGVDYPFEDYKSFGVATNLDGTFKLIFTPTKRLVPAFEVDFNTDDGEKIVDFLGARLPMKEVELNFIDRIVQRIGLW